MQSDMDRTGYPKLADYVALEPQLAIFKRFGALNAENLYYMQAEIASLEEELRQIIADDTKSRDRKVQQFSKSWRILQAAGENSAQWQKRMEIRVRLKEYSEYHRPCDSRFQGGGNRVTNSQMRHYCSACGSSKSTRPTRGI